MPKTQTSGTVAATEVDFSDIRLNGPILKAATFNGTFADPGDGSGLPDLADPGETIRGKPVLEVGTSNTPGNVRWQLDAGVEIAPTKGVITYSFLDSAHATGIYNNPNQGFTEQFGYSPFSAAQRVAGRIAINNWDELIAPSFKEVNGSGGADIVMANTTTGPAQAWAYYPYNYGEPQYNHLMSDAWIATPSVNGSNAQLDPGFYGLQTLNHELGHTLGLSHPGNYNFGDDTDGDGVADPITFEGDAFYFQDNHQYTIMSYFDSFEAGNNQVDWNLMRFVYPSTPMVHDVAIIQQKYGADMTTRTGDTVYGFNSTADVTNAAMKFNPGDMLTMFTIWDAGGNDTLDLSGYYTDSVIDLRPGAYSSAGGMGAYSPTLADTDPSAMGKTAYLNFVNGNNAALGYGARTAAYDLYFGGRAGANEGVPWFDIMGHDTLMENNIGIAYGATIENAIGGHGDDRINGNSAANKLTGGAGADTFIFVKDGSIDTITDFKSGLDKIDLSEVPGLNASKVFFDAANDTLKIDTDGINGYDMFVIVKGDDVVISDIFFG
ncbi:MAG TPA: M10 family metallopeptidase C-terminal domain-containing protein [Allosphingosinicella sp.]|jgi:Ca2+-binding RTX toxin-like protein